MKIQKFLSFVFIIPLLTSCNSVSFSEFNTEPFTLEDGETDLKEYEDSTEVDNKEFMERLNEKFKKYEYRGYQYRDFIAEKTYYQQYSKLVNEEMTPYSTYIINFSFKYDYDKDVFQKLLYSSQNNHVVDDEGNIQTLTESVYHHKDVYEEKTVSGKEMFYVINPEQEIYTTAKYTRKTDCYVGYYVNELCLNYALRYDYYWYSVQNKDLVNEDDSLFTRVFTYNDEIFAIDQLYFEDNYVSHIKIKYGQYLDFATNKERKQITVESFVIQYRSCNLVRTSTTGYHKISYSKDLLPQYFDFTAPKFLS